MSDNVPAYRKGHGRNKRLVRRAGHRDLRAFVYAAMRWLQIAPMRFWDWDDQPVELKTYMPGPKGKERIVRCEPRWLAPTTEIRRLAAGSGCPLEVLAVAAWDIIKSLPMNAYGSRAKRKTQYADAIERRDKAKTALAKGGKPNDRDIRAFDHYQARNYGYVDADDLSLPIESEKLSETPEMIRGGDFGKTRTQRRKPLGKGSRKRWPRPPDNYLCMPNRMRTYWRKHAAYEKAYQTIAASCTVRAEMMRALRESRDAAPQTPHSAFNSAFFTHDGFVFGSQENT